MGNTDRPLVQPIHTAIAGRARYKVTGLWRCESLQRYLESKLAMQQDISLVRGNINSGNLLVIFSPHLDYRQVAQLIDNCLMNFRQRLGDGYLNKKINRTLMPVISAASLAAILSVLTGVIYARNWDEAILLNIRKLHHPILDGVFLTTTLLGEPAILLSLCWSLSSFGGFTSHAQGARFVTNATLTAIGLNLFLKYIFARPRPLLWERIIPVDPYSFPSGHAMVSMVTYGAIAYVLACEFPQQRQQILLVAAILIAAIGFSRLYLGVHWLTDITAGYAAGLMVLAGLLMYQKLLGKSFQTI